MAPDINSFNSQLPYRCLLTLYHIIVWTAVGFHSSLDSNQTSLPLRIDRNPKRKRLSSNHASFFKGELLNFGGGGGVTKQSIEQPPFRQGILAFFCVPGKPMISRTWAVSVWTFFLDQASVFNSTHTSVKTSAFRFWAVFPLLPEYFRKTWVSKMRGLKKWPGWPQNKRHLQVSSSQLWESAVQWFSMYLNTVDGRNPAPPEMCKTR